ncbi:stage II sporulation protein P [Clostridium polynesiense]|uniref:stage II sporulation protein P n=1 Tax=Clostridium polynesiense TaxID=1325933 RepID=UPI00058F7E2B|nr:stage II sporulation protein P [Clostridium polynesiense]
MPYSTKVNNELHLKPIVYIAVSALIVVLMVMGLLNSVMKSQVKNNMFYIQVLNYSLPIVKDVAYDESDMAESQMNLRTALLEYIGIDAFNPLNILSKENSYFSLGRKYLKPDMKSHFALDSFKLDDISIFREEKKEESDSASQETKADIYNPAIKKNLNESKPEVLIYHTHTTEYYSPATLGSPFDENLSVVAVGREIAKELQQNYGISVIHDRTIHNTLYQNSYTRSGETLDKYLKKYNDFKIIIDLHRDSGPSKKDITCKINGQDAAKLMFVLSRSSGYIKNNESLANSLKGFLDKNFPGISKPTKEYNRGKGNFNQSKNPNVVLIEVGADVNKIEEALFSGKIIARAIAEHINGKK